MRAITTDNSSDVIAIITHRNKNLLELNMTRYRFSALSDFHVRCIAQVINISVKYFLRLIRNLVSNVPSVINSIRCFFKRRQMYNDIRVELQIGAHVTVPPLDVETRWSSTFTMLRAAYKARRILSEISNRVPELDFYVISQVEWKKKLYICEFMAIPASIT